MKRARLARVRARVFAVEDETFPERIAPTRKLVSGRGAALEREGDRVGPSEMALERECARLAQIAIEAEPPVGSRSLALGFYRDRRRLGPIEKGGEDPTSDRHGIEIEAERTVGLAKQSPQSEMLSHAVGAPCRQTQRFFARSERERSLGFKARLYRRFNAAVRETKRLKHDAHGQVECHCAALGGRGLRRAEEDRRIERKRLHGNAPVQQIERAPRERNSTHRKPSACRIRNDELVDHERPRPIAGKRVVVDLRSLACERAQERVHDEIAAAVAREKKARSQEERGERRQADEARACNRMSRPETHQKACPMLT